MVKPLPAAHLHDSAEEIPHGGCGVAVLIFGSGVARPVHVGLALHLGNPQTVDDNMHMDIAAMVVSVRVGADKDLVSGEMLFAVGKPLNACVRSTVRPLSAASRGSKLMI